MIYHVMFWMFLLDLSQWFVIVFQCWQLSEIASLQKIIPYQIYYPYMEKHDFFYDVENLRPLRRTSLNAFLLALATKQNEHL